MHSSNQTSKTPSTRLRLTLAAAALVAGIGAAGNAMADSNELASSRAHGGAVFTMTNDAAGNHVVAFERRVDGTLRQDGVYATNGLGTSKIRLSSQGSLQLTADGRFLLVANVGSNQISVFAVRGTHLDLVDVVSSHGTTPNSITIHGNLVYVLNNGGTGIGNIAGFELQPDGKLHFLPGTIRSLATAGADPAQVVFTPDADALIITEKATSKIDSIPLTFGFPTELTTHDSAGVTPFGVDFRHDGVFVVTNAVNGDKGQASASAYELTGPANDRLRTLSAAIPDGRSEVCWAIFSKDEKHVFITNFGDGTISSYDVHRDGSISLKEAVAASTTFGELSIRDEELSEDGEYLYAIDITAQKVFGWHVGHDGQLTAVGSVGGVPGTVAGIAVR
jgi:6-phosphogluconolactonase